MLSFNPVTSALIATASSGIVWFVVSFPHFPSYIFVYSVNALVFTSFLYNAYSFNVYSPSSNVYPFAFVKLVYPGTCIVVNLYSLSDSVWYVSLYISNKSSVIDIWYPASSAFVVVVASSVAVKFMSFSIVSLYT